VRETVERVVTPFLAVADAALGAGYSAVLYGSAVRGDFAPGRSDINLMLVLDDASPAVLRSLGGGLREWRKSGYEPPLLLTRAEWDRASDAFPIEITDMRVAYSVLRGADPLVGVTVAPTDLRRALEREFRGKLLRLRQGYAASAGEPAALGALAGASAGTIMVLLRCLLALLGCAVPAGPLELAAAASAVLGDEGEHLLNVIRHRSERGWRCSPEEFENYLGAVAHAARFLDQLQPGDS